MESCNFNVIVILQMFAVDQNKESVKGQKPLQLSTTISLHPERQAHSEMGLGQTMVRFPPFALLLNFTFFSNF